jgi:hypothetical protein
LSEGVGERGRPFSSTPAHEVPCEGREASLSEHPCAKSPAFWPRRVPFLTSMHIKSRRRATRAPLQRLKICRITSASPLQTYAKHTIPWWHLFSMHNILCMVLKSIKNETKSRAMPPAPAIDRSSSSTSTCKLTKKTAEDSFSRLRSASLLLTWHPYLYPKHGSVVTSEGMRGTHLK